MLIVRARVDAATLAAIERAAALDERNVSDWMRVVLKRELRRLKLLPDGAAPARKGVRRGR